MNTESDIPLTAAPPTPQLHRRGCLFLIGRAFKWFIILLIALIVLGVAYQTAATELDKRAYSPRGQLYQVNGQQMHLVCAGEGSPTVILQAGATAESLWWDHIQNSLAETTRVCAYDRPGLGWSEPVASPRDPITMSNELHALLQAADVETPYVMVGHSFGAVLARVYAAQYPDDVIGMVLVDSQFIDEAFATQSAYDEWKASNDAIQAVVWVMYRTGLGRLLFANQFHAVGYPAEIAAEITALQMRNQSFDVDYAERILAMEAVTQASADARNFGDLPLAVIWTPVPQGIYANDAAREASLARRDEFATFSSNTVIRIIDGSDHISLLGNEQHAQQVTDAILAVIDSAQTGNPLTP